MSLVTGQPRFGVQGRHVVWLFGICWFLPYVLYLLFRYHADALDTLYAFVAQGFDDPLAGFGWFRRNYGLAFLLTQLALVYIVLGKLQGVTWRDLGFRRPAMHWFLVALAALLLIKFGTAALLSVADPEISTSGAGRPAGLAERTLLAILVPLAISAFVTPVVEETIFRGVIHGWLRTRCTVLVSVCASAALFSLVHLRFFDGGVAGCISTAEIFLGGVVLALLYEKSGSLWPSIYMHGTNNAITTLIALSRA